MEKIFSGILRIFSLGSLKFLFVLFSSKISNEILNNSISEKPSKPLLPSREIFRNQNENPNYSRENYSKIFLEKPKKEFDCSFSPCVWFERGKKPRLQISSKYKQIKTTKFDRIWCKQYPYQSLLVLITDQGNVRSWRRPPNYPSENISTRSDGSITNIYDVREHDIDEDRPTSQTKVLEGRREKGTRGTQYIIDWH